MFCAKKYDVNRSPFLVNQTVPVHPGPFQKLAGYTAYACQTDPSVDQVNPICHSIH